MARPPLHRVAKEEEHGEFAGVGAPGGLAAAGGQKDLKKFLMRLALKKAMRDAGKGFPERPAGTAA